MKPLKTNYIRNRRLICKKIREEYIVINPDNNSFFTLNATGETIVRFLYKKRNFDEIISKLNDEYLTNLKQVKQDLKLFLELSVINGLVRKIQK